MDLSIALSGVIDARAIDALRAIVSLLTPYGVKGEFLSSAPTAAFKDLPGHFPVRPIAPATNACGDFIRAARDSACGRWLITLESPAPSDSSLVYAFWQRRQTADLLIASRYTWGGSCRMPWGRTLISRGLNALYRSGLALPVRDLSSARRMYRLDLLRLVDITGDDYEVLMEILLKFMSKGGKVAEVPWHFESRESRQTPGTTARLFTSCLRTFGRMHALRNSVDFPDYDYRAYDSRIWFQKYWQRRRFRIIRDFEGPFPGLTLDAGCGSSRIITTRPEMIALDLNVNRLRLLRDSNPRRLQATAGALPFPDNTFDTVISSQVIEHTPERTCILELSRVLKPGGAIIVGTPDYGRIWWPITEKIYGWVKRGGYADEHITHYTLETLRDELQQAGCDILGYRYICGGELIMHGRKPIGRTIPSSGSIVTK